jgi:hypothetical protein
MSDKEIPVITPEKITLTYRHKTNNKVFKDKAEWEAAGYTNEDIAQDVTVLMPRLDLFAETK